MSAVLYHIERGAGYDAEGEWHWPDGELKGNPLAPAKGAFWGLVFSLLLWCGIAGGLIWAMWGCR